MAIDFQQTRELLQFQYNDLFIQQMGWSFPSTEKAVLMEDGQTYHR